MTSRFPQDIDQNQVILEGDTLDAAGHTALHVDAIDRTIAIQTFIGRPVAGEPQGQTIRQRLFNLEGRALTPIQSTSAVDLPAGSQPTAQWNNTTGHLEIGVPRGRDGAPGAAGQLNVVSGTLTQVSVAPGVGPQGYPISFPGVLPATPRVYTTPVQKTTGSTVGQASVTSLTGGTSYLSGFQCYRGTGTFNETGSTEWTESPSKTRLMVGKASSTSTYGNHRSLVKLHTGNLAGIPSNATISRLTVTFTISSDTVNPNGAPELVIKPYKVGDSLPSTLPTPASTYPTYTAKKTFSAGVHTIELPIQWAEGFRNGTYDAVMFGPQPSDDVSRYARITGNSLTLKFEWSTPGSVQSINSRPVLCGVRDVTPSGFVLTLENTGSATELVEVNWLAI